MPLKSVVKLFLTFVLSLASLSMASAQEMVSIKGSVVNMRDGPSLKSEVLWELSRGYPLQVIGSQGSWWRVQDFEGDKGWVSKKMVSRTAHLIVKSPRANLRSGPSTKHLIVGNAQYGEVLRTLERQSRWVQVQRSNGKKVWIARSLVWGW